MARARRNREGTDNAGSEDNSDSQQTIVLGVYLHCQGCVNPVIKCLEAIQGVEEVDADFTNHNLIVKGQKDVDPKKISERIVKKFNKQVQIIAPKLKVQDVPEEKKEEEPKIVQVTLNVYVHCKNCANNIEQRIQNMTGVTNIEIDVEKSQVVVKGEFEPPKLVEYVEKRMGKQASIEKIENLNNRRECQKDNKSNNNKNKRKNNKDNGPSMEHVPCTNGCNPQQMDLLYSSQSHMFSDEKTEACIIM